VSVSWLILGGSEEMLNLKGSSPQSFQGAPRVGSVLMTKSKPQEVALLEGTSKEVSVQIYGFMWLVGCMECMGGEARTSRSMSNSFFVPWAVSGKSLLMGMMR